MLTGGDVDASVQRLAAELRRLRYPANFDAAGARQGRVGCILPVVHYILLGASKLVASWLLNKGYELNCKTDARFVDAVWRLCRAEFVYRPPLTVAQFLTDDGFAVAKLAVVTSIALHCKALHNSLLREQRAKEPAAASIAPQNLRTAQRATSLAARRKALESAASGLERARVEVVPAQQVDYRVERWMDNGDTAPADDTTSFLQRRLADAERIISSQAAALARLESRLHVLELSRPPSRVEPVEAYADPSDEALEAFMARVGHQIKATQALLANVQ